MAAKKITVIRETTTGLNTHFDVPGHGEMTRGQLANQIERVGIEGYHVRRVEGRRIIASNPDSSRDNNLD